MPTISELINAIHAGDLPTVEQFLNQEPALVNARSEWEWAPLHWAADQRAIAIMNLLIARGADVGAVDNKGETPRFFASNPAKREDNAAEAMLVLLEAGADVNHPNHEGRTPLHERAFYGEHAESQFL